MDKNFDFELGQTVNLALSNETGLVIGRASYLKSENQYQVRYMDAQGSQVESWWAESALASLETLKQAA